jgi:hypothetical protein
MVDQKIFINSLHDFLSKVVIPNMEYINQRLGQENDPRFISYLIEYILIRERTIQ